jgi:putative restriction endonuclease
MRQYGGDPDHWLQDVIGAASWLAGEHSGKREVGGLTPDDLLGLLARLRRARVGDVRVPHKPLLLLWLFGRFAATGSSLATYAAAEEPVSSLINEFGPPVKSPTAARSRAAMPFVHLERQLWDLRDGQGREIGPDAPERRTWLTDRDAVGRLRPEVEQLLSSRGTLAAAARLLLDRHFTPLLADLICAEVDLDMAGLNAAAPPETTRIRQRARRSGFAEEVLRAYAYQCAMCGFDGALGRTPVGIEAAHVRWHSQDGPDNVANGLALCALHHVLLDLGVLGLTADRRICVSGLYVARSDAGKAVDALAGQPLLAARPGQPTVDIAYVSWHNVQVFKGSHEPAPSGAGR